MLVKHSQNILGRLYIFTLMTFVSTTHFSAVFHLPFLFTPIYFEYFTVNIFSYALAVFMIIIMLRIA